MRQNEINFLFCSIAVCNKLACKAVFRSRFPLEDKRLGVSLSWDSTLVTHPIKINLIISIGMFFSLNAMLPTDYAEQEVDIDDKNR